MDFGGALISISGSWTSSDMFVSSGFGLKKTVADFLRNSLSRVEIQLIGRHEYCTDVRAAMSGTADPETGVQISVRAPFLSISIWLYNSSFESVE